MATGNDGVPTSAEVESQLKRMLASKCLKTSPNRRKLLEYVVKKYLENKEISEDIIGYALFPGYAADESDIVRVTANHLRKSIALYYAGEGVDDRVRIDLPSGPKYRPDCSYSHRSPAARHCALGLHHYATMTHVNDGLTAIYQFNKAIALDPGYAPAYAARAETEFIRASYAQHPDTAALVVSAEASANEALRLNSGLWQPHVVLGAVHSCRCAWDQAEAAFDAALKAAPDKTPRHVWFAAYLLATGRAEKALHLVGLAAKDAPGDPVAQSIYALFLYLTRDFRQAEALLRDVKLADRWLMHVVFACVLQRDQESDLSHCHIAQAHKILHDWVFPGLEVLCLLSGSLKTQAGREERAHRLFSMLREDSAAKPFQKALCHLAFAEPEEAIAALRQARDEHEPLMIWLHLWPLFDPLRGFKEFQQLIREMNFPSGH